MLLPHFRYPTHLSVCVSPGSTPPHLRLSASTNILASVSQPFPPPSRHLFHLSRTWFLQLITADFRLIYPSVLFILLISPKTSTSAIIFPSVLICPCFLIRHVRDVCRHPVYLLLVFCLFKNLHRSCDLRVLI